MHIQTPPKFLRERDLLGISEYEKFWKIEHNNDHTVIDQRSNLSWIQQQIPKEKLEHRQARNDTAWKYISSHQQFRSQGPFQIKGLSYFLIALSIFFSPQNRPVHSESTLKCPQV